MSQAKDVVFVPGASATQAREIQATALLPEGTFLFNLAPASVASLYSQSGEFIVIQIPTGQTLLEVSRDPDRVLQFTHASPGTGTRIASLSLPPLVHDLPFLVALTWTKDETTLYAGFLGSPPLSATGTKATYQVRVKDETIFRIGSPEVEVFGYQMFADGRLQLRESALEAWESTHRAINIHMQATPTEGFLGEVVQANLAIVMMATGFEVYTERRFRELPEEGRPADVRALLRRFLSAAQREHPAAQTSTVDEALSVARVDFGNHEQCKRAFGAAYGLRFSADLGLQPATLSAVQRSLTYRHQIVHVSPLIGMLNQRTVPPEQPVFPSRSLVPGLLLAMDTFLLWTTRGHSPTGPPHRAGGRRPGNLRPLPYQSGRSGSMPGLSTMRGSSTSC